MMKKTLSVIIPLYNEDPSAYEQIIRKMNDYNSREGMLPHGPIQLIVVDDGSDVPVDGATLRRETSSGYGNAIKWGMSHATGRYIGIIDGDNQYDPNDLIEMWKVMEDEDMLIGKRICHQGGLKRWAGRIFIRIFASLLALRYIPDLNSGSRIFKKQRAMDYGSILCDEFSFTASLSMCMLLDRCTVKWLPVGFYPRKGSASTVKMLRHGLITIRQIVYIAVGLRTRKIGLWLRR